MELKQYASSILVDWLIEKGIRVEARFSPDTGKYFLYIFEDGKLVSGGNYCDKDEDKVIEYGLQEALKLIKNK